MYRTNSYRAPPAKVKHDFTFVRWGDGTYEEPLKIARYTCVKYGAKADSRTLYVMDREECRPTKGTGSTGPN